MPFPLIVCELSLTILYRPGLPRRSARAAPSRKLAQLRAGSEGISARARGNGNVYSNLTTTPFERRGYRRTKFNVCAGSNPIQPIHSMRSGKVADQPLPSIRVADNADTISIFPLLKQLAATGTNDPNRGKSSTHRDV